MHIWVPKKKRGLHFEARARHRDTDGRLIKDTGWCHNMLHDSGEELILNVLFEPAFTTYPWQLLTVNAAYTYDTKTLTGPDAANFAQYLSVGDYIYVVGGYKAGSASLTGSYSRVATNADDDTVTLTLHPTGATADLDGGIVVIRPINFCIALDRRTALAETDTVSSVEAYEEDSDTYFREVVDPIDATNTFWTVAQDEDTGDYQATSDQVSFTAVAETDWNANRNAALIAGLCDTDTIETHLRSTYTQWSNDVLISSVAFDDPITVGSGQSLGVQFRLRLKEAT